MQRIAEKSRLWFRSIACPLHSTFSFLLPHSYLFSCPFMNNKFVLLWSRNWYTEDCIFYYWYIRIACISLLAFHSAISSNYSFRNCIFLNIKRALNFHVWINASDNANLQLMIFFNLYLLMLIVTSILCLWALLKLHFQGWPGNFIHSID